MTMRLPKTKRMCFAIALIASGYKLLLVLASTVIASAAASSDFPTIGCKNCITSTAYEEYSKSGKHHSDEQSLRRLEEQRLMLEKKKILLKLRLQDRPQISLPVSAASALPLPLVESLHSAERQQQQIQIDKEQTIPKETYVFTELLFADCPIARDAKSKSVCFKLKQGIGNSSFKSVFLWIYKQDLDSVDRVVDVSELLATGEVKLTSRRAAVNSGSWQKIDITSLALQWQMDAEASFELSDESDPNENAEDAIGQRKEQKILFVNCQSCSDDVYAINETPFLEIVERKPDESSKRIRRHQECSPGLYNQCCLKKWYVNFTEIGWSDWIIQPRGYYANYCTGNCRNHAKEVHTSMLINSWQQKLSNGETIDPELIPCCAATKKAPLVILFALQAKQFTRAVLDDMIVESCGC